MDMPCQGAFFPLLNESTGMKSRSLRRFLAFSVADCWRRLRCDPGAPTFVCPTFGGRFDDSRKVIKIITLGHKKLAGSGCGVNTVDLLAWPELCGEAHHPLTKVVAGNNG